MDKRHDHDQGFALHRARLAAHLIAQDGPVFGFDTVGDETRPASAVVGRFYTAQAADAISSPPDAKMMVYPLSGRALIVTVREIPPAPHLSWPLRQMATHSFDVDEVAPPGATSFDSYYRGLAELLERANTLLPDLRELRGAGRAASRDVSPAAAVTAPRRIRSQRRQQRRR